MMKKTLLLALAALSLSAPAMADRLDDIQKAGVIRVGTTGDYKPFSYFDGKNYSGYDIDVAAYVADQLGVKVELVKTTWKTLISDLSSNKYDIAMGGITRKVQRQLNAEQTQGYMTFGKCFLVAKGRATEFDSLGKVNQPSVKVGYNAGGTNESFAKNNLKQSSLVKFENNLDVPKAVVDGKVDVMVTETPEAMYYQVTNNHLESVRCHEPFTQSQFGYLIPKGEQRLLNTVNFIMDEMKLKGVDDKLMKKMR